MDSFFDAIEDDSLIPENEGIWNISFPIFPNFDTEILTQNCPRTENE